jgi:uncharacterized protein with HEPN domain
MNKRPEQECLADIVAWGERLQRHLSDVDRDHFLGSEVLQDAVAKCIEAIGEAAKLVLADAGGRSASEFVAVVGSCN